MQSYGSGCGPVAGEMAGPFLDGLGKPLQVVVKTDAPADILMYLICAWAGDPYQRKFGCRLMPSASFPLESNAIWVLKNRKSPALTAWGS